MGIRVDEPAYVFGDNQSVLANTENTGSILKKTTSAITYHFVREGCCRDKWRTAYINKHKNITNLVTKLITDTDKRWRFIATMLLWVAPSHYYVNGS